MSKANPFYEVKRLVCELSGRYPDTVTPETPLRCLPAVDRATVIIACEKKFHITLHDEEIIDFQTLGDLSACILDKLADGREDYTTPTDSQRDAWYYR